MFKPKGIMFVFLIVGFLTAKLDLIAHLVSWRISIGSIRRRRCLIFVFFVISLLSANPARAQREPLEGLDAYIRKSMSEWQVPGLAIAIVKDDSVVFLKGYGLRQVGKDAKDAQFHHNATTGTFAIIGG